MPKMDGREVLKRVRRSLRTATLPVIVLTASEKPEDEIEPPRVRGRRFRTQAHRPGASRCPGESGAAPGRRVHLSNWTTSSVARSAAVGPRCASLSRSLRRQPVLQPLGFARVPRPRARTVVARGLRDRHFRDGEHGLEVRLVGWAGEDPERLLADRGARAPLVRVPVVVLYPQEGPLVDGGLYRLEARTLLSLSKPRPSRT